MTDVNIATQLILDAYEDKFDTAIFMSGDSDLTTPITMLRERFKDKRFIVAFPPGRESFHLGASSGDGAYIHQEEQAQKVFAARHTKKSSWLRG